MKKFIPHILLLSLLLGFLLTFSINSLAFSARKAFWVDEVYGFVETIQKQSYLEMIISGPIGQGSPSPLNYLVTKSIYDLRKPLQYLGLQPFQYFRFSNILLTWAVILYLFYLYSRHFSLKNLTIFTFSSVFFIFNKSLFYFSSEMRPYKLWAILSFLVLFLFPFRKQQKKAWIISLVALTLTATASIYQTTSLIVAILVSKAIFQKKIIPKIKINATLITIGVTYLIHFYYITRIGSYGYPTPKWSAFLEFWQPYLAIIIFGLVLSWINFQRKQKDDFVISLTAVGWLIFGPISFYLTQQKGFFFAPRQYIYYYPVLALFIYQFIKRIISLKGDPKLDFVIFFSLGIYLLFFTFKRSTFGFLIAAKLIKSDQLVSLPVNHQKIKPLIPDKIPAHFEFTPIDQKEQHNSVARHNLNIWQSYLNDIYPTSEYPRDQGSTLHVRAREYSIELVEILPKK